MGHSHVKILSLKLETFISVVLCFSSLLITKVLFGIIKGVEMFFEKLGFFNFLKFKSQSKILLVIIITILVLFFSLRIDIPNLHLRFIIVLSIYLLGFGLLIRLGEIALETPSSFDEIDSQIQKSKAKKWFAYRMKNPNDVVWIQPMIALSILVIPVFVGILIPTSFNVFTVLAYGTIFSIGFNAINAFEHTNSHNRFFKISHLSKKDMFYFKTLELYCEYILNFMFARIPHWYRIQHVVIHHVEDNGEQDTQSTLRYDRSSFIDFTKCAFRFAVSGLFSLDIIKYLIRKKRKKALRELLIGMIFFYILLLVISFWNWPFVVTIIAFRFIGQVISTLGFLHEHGMIDISAPQNIYRNSLHFITTENSHASLGDDAHIEHHLHQGRHWSEYVDDYRINIPNYENENSLGFKDSPGGLSKYFYFLWRKDFKSLASLFVIYGNAEASSEEVANLLMERTRPFLTSMRNKRVGKIDEILGWSASYLLPWWQENKP